MPHSSMQKYRTQLAQGHHVCKNKSHLCFCAHSFCYLAAQTSPGFSLVFNVIQSFLLNQGNHIFRTFEPVKTKLIDSPLKFGVGGEPQKFTEMISGILFILVQHRKLTYQLLPLTKPTLILACLEPMLDIITHHFLGCITPNCSMLVRKRK